MKNEVVEIPIIIGGKEYKTPNKVEIHAPHDNSQLLGYVANYIRDVQ